MKKKFYSNYEKKLIDKAIKLCFIKKLCKIFLYEKTDLASLDCQDFSSLIIDLSSYTNIKVDLILDYITSEIMSDNNALKKIIDNLKENQIKRINILRTWPKNTVEVAEKIYFDEEEAKLIIKMLKIFLTSLWVATLYQRSKRQLTLIHLELFGSKKTGPKNRFK